MGVLYITVVVMRLVDGVDTAVGFYVYQKRRGYVVTYRVGHFVCLLIVKIRPFTVFDDFAPQVMHTSIPTKKKNEAVDAHP